MCVIFFETEVTLYYQGNRGRPAVVAASIIKQKAD